ncbi:MAG: HEAT repeat domain-containing protein [Deltaproteobacteria bacterium]|nr:HEAT repeat domain-containing protein [Deltaproteobacteria bacterium]
MRGLFPATCLAALVAVACAPVDERPPPDLASRNKALDAAREQIWIMGRAGPERAMEGLAHADPRVRRAAAKRLGALGASAALAVPSLVRRLEDGDRFAACQAAMALADIGDPAAIPGLVEALANDTPEVRVWAGKSLIRFGDPAVKVLMESLGSDSPISALTYSDLRGEPVSIRMAVKDTLAAMGPKAVPGLIAALENDDRSVRLNASGVLGRMGPAARDAIPALIKALESDDPNMRMNAAGDLGKIGDLDPALVPALKVAAGDKDPKVAEAARNALRTIGPANRDKTPPTPPPDRRLRPGFGPRPSPAGAPQMGAELSDLSPEPN